MAKKEDPTTTLANVNAAQLAAQVANWAAQLDFQKERLRLLELPQYQQASQMEIDKLAFAKAESTWKQAIEEASVTGSYQGQPTMAWLEQQAKMTGVINGQQTLEGKLTDAQIAQMNHAMQMQTEQMLLDREKFGFDKSKWDAEFGYQQQKDAKDYELAKSGLSGYMGDGTSTLAREQMQGQQAQAYLGLLSSVQANPFKVQRILGQAGSGLNGLAAAWTGKYQPAGFAGGEAPQQAQVADLYQQYDPNTGLPIATPQQPVAASVGQIQQPAIGVPGGAVVPQPVSTMPVGTQPVDPTQRTGGVAIDPQVYAGGTYKYQEPGTQASAAVTDTGYTYSPPGTQAPVDAYNYQGTTSGQTQVYPPGVQAPAMGAQASTTTPQTAAGSNAIASGALSPSQIDARAYSKTNPYLQKLGWMAYDDAGIPEEAAKGAFMASLPKYAYKGGTGKVLTGV